MVHLNVVFFKCSMRYVAKYRKLAIFHIREVKHDVYGKRQKWNFYRLSSALCAVESKDLYLLWIVFYFIFLFLCDLFKDYQKKKENQR